MSTTLLELVEEITSSLDNNKYAIGVFVDLKNTFDTVDHDILAKILHFYLDKIQIHWKCHRYRHNNF